MMRFLLVLFLAVPQWARAQGSVPTLTYELDPIVITAPRRRVQEERLDPRINRVLLKLLQDSKELRPGAQIAIDSSIDNLGKLVTQTGHKLKTRYTELSFLLLEGLAGVENFQLQNELQRVTIAGGNPQLRAAAMVALGYTKDERFLADIQPAILDQNVTVRLGALEALLVMDNTSAQAQVAQMGRDDAAMAIRVIAAAEDWKKGSIFSRQLMRDYARHDNWFVRAMAIRYVGELGRGFEYRQLQGQLISEVDPIVRAELAGALLQLKKYKNE
jgi:hypothetical protein